MEEIVAQVQHVSQLIGEISSATSEQATGIGQVGDAINQLDQVTQQNAALVEESAAAADSLRQQAARLAEVVRVFKLGGASDAVQPLARAEAANSPVIARSAPQAVKSAPSAKTKARPATAPSATEPTHAHAVSQPGKTGTDNWETF
jgi:septal ring factor EnvC (AmiA/AmiB activator)